VTLPATFVIGVTVYWRVTPAAHPAPTPPPALRVRFDSLLATAYPDARLPPPVFTHTILRTLKHDRRSEPVWIADAHAEGTWGVRIVLSADTGAVTAFSSEVWAAHRQPDRTAPPEIRTAADARSAARRILLWLQKPAIPDADLHVTAPEGMVPSPCGTWLVSAHRGDRHWMVALDGQTGNLLDFRDEVTASRSNP
jgi:hypothetical protein